LAIESGRKINQFHDDILDSVEAESGMSKETESEFNLDQAVQDIVSIKKPIAIHKKIALTAEISDQTPCHLKGLKQSFQRVLLNLLGNALKFTEIGSVSLLIGLDGPKKAIQAGEKVILKIQVQDTGIGIPHDKFDEIFDQFSRLTASYEGLYKGLGLGLHSVKQYLEKMQGKIEVKSQVGEGSCFTVYIPFEVVKMGLSQFIPSSDISTQSVQHEFKKEDERQPEKEIKSSGKRILLVEDDKIVSLATRMNLSKLGCLVDTAESGEEALEKIKENEYQLVFMDIGLPNMSGIETALAIRGLTEKEKAKVPIVALTGHARSQSRKLCLDAGMQGVFSKPMSLEDLKKALDYFAS
jgi:CheY-like chemotaxis protein